MNTIENCLIENCRNLGYKYVLFCRYLHENITDKEIVYPYLCNQKMMPFDPSFERLFSAIEIDESFFLKNFNSIQKNYIRDFFGCLSFAVVKNPIEKTKHYSFEYATKSKNLDLLFIYYFLVELIFEGQSIFTALEFSRRINYITNIESKNKLSKFILDLECEDSESIIEVIKHYKR